MRRFQRKHEETLLEQKQQSVTIVIPVLNEESTIQVIVDEICAALRPCREWQFHILFVDDGSSDSSWERIQTAHAARPDCVSAIRLRRNFGKSDALSIGFDNSATDVVITMDADLQDDPKEIPRFLEKIAEGFDLVSGWKQQRNDPLSKTLPSRLFNFITSRLTKVRLRDFNSGFKAYRRETLRSLHLYGEMHRYIPVMAAHMGFRIAEIPVNHRPRAHGVSKYGLERYARGFLDLATVLATTRYVRRPGHLFGGLGLLIGAIGMASLLYLTAIWALDLGAIGNRPLLLFGVLCVLLAAQLLSLGVVAELSLSQSHVRPSAIQIRESLGEASTATLPADTRVSDKACLES